MRDMAGLFYNVISYQIGKGRSFVEKRVYVPKKRPDKTGGEGAAL